MNAPRATLAIDLASVVTLGEGGLQRCLDTAFHASRDGSSVPVLRNVYAALDRVLVAHVTCDPFVAELPGTSELMGWAEREGLAVVGIAAFSLQVSEALRRRLRWSPHLELRHAGTGPMWDVLRDSSREGAATHPPRVFLSDDTWELAYATASGCDQCVSIGRHARAEELATLGIVATSGMRDAASCVSAFLGARTARPDLTKAGRPKLHSARAARGGPSP